MGEVLTIWLRGFLGLAFGFWSGMGVFVHAISTGEVLELVREHQKSDLEHDRPALWEA